MVEYDTPWFLDHPGPSAKRLRHLLTSFGGCVLDDALAHPSCQVLLDLVLSCDKPLFVAWGTELRVLHNDACYPMFRGRLSMGRRMCDVWSERWREIDRDVAPLMQGGHPRTTPLDLGCPLKGHLLSGGELFFDCTPVNGPLSREKPLGLFCVFRGYKLAMLQRTPPSVMTTASPQTDPLQAQPAALRVLIADDHVDAAETLAMLVGLEGHAVEVACNGQDALTLARRLRPDVAILDIGMPGLDGHAVAHHIRQTQAGESMLIVALTGRGDAEDKERAQVAGFDEHFTKPVDPALLLGCIRAWQHRR